MLKHWLVLLSLLFAVNLAVADDLPPTFSAEYVIEKGIIDVGKATRTFQRRANGDLYYVSESKTTGMLSYLLRERISESTHFEQFEGGIRPLQYSKKRDGRRKLRVNQAFNWQKGKVDVTVDDEAFSYEVPNASLDQNLYLLSVMVDLKRGERDLNYAIAENRRLKQYHIKKIGEERVDTTFGAMETIVLRRKDNKVETILWCAPELDYLPVQIRHTEGGTDFTARITSLKGIEVPFIPNFDW